MKLVDLLPPERVFVNIDIAEREQLLAFFAEKAGALGLVGSDECLQALTDREELGSTGLGKGIAIPHARIPSLETPVAMLATLARPIDFDAPDQEPIDIAVMLLLPKQSGEQIKVLSQVARFARQDSVVDELRRADTTEQVLVILADAEDDL
ncbi:PTS IIA-like nitrogen-regulatory protein PtsN [Devosia lucknowensis]|uniref:PTS IIA-like nitrogen-regulatory protein PtsN n=1 Tax=Devosia lucknowensis TaxID=1096929 RepID=A0A1Y6EUS0_9HYPH|nr:PTS sugar transporter subunit IIA [Devosia lucknowensis]SMQ63943.1 PTS IIA-like nitrogen-regulatory protein PtsN [Devosia lucknowensis]